MNSSNSSSSDEPPSLQSLRIQLPENNQPSENGICQPPLDPPSFDVPNVRRCIKTTVRIQNYDKPQEVLILTSISSSVDSILSSFDDSQKSNNNNNNTDSFDDSDFSDFSETTTSFSEEEETEDDEMEEDEDEGGTIQNGTHHNNYNENVADGKTIPQSTTRNNAPKNQGYRMKAYWLRNQLVENSHGVFKTHVYYAKVIEKADFNWVVTNEAVAIKAVSWRCITACRNRLSEDFVKEIAALKYISDWHSGRNFRETHVLKADTVMSNESHLYTVMPYCDGGEFISILLAL